jgi:eukaryotic-like serine/threonine-protein kinase
VLELLGNAVLSDPDSAQVRAALAEAQWLKFRRTAGNVWLERAVETARQAEARDPDLAPVHLVEGLLLSRFGKYDEAAIRFERAIELDPNNGEGYRRLATIYESKGQTEWASAMLDRAVTLGPKAYLAWWDRGHHEFRRGNYTAAVADFLQATKLAPDEPGPEADLAQAYLSSGRIEEAETAAKAAIELERSPRALNIFGLTLLGQAKELQATPYLIESAEKQPTALYWFYVGVAYRRTSKFSEAQAANRRGFDLARMELERDYRNGLARAILASLAAALGDRGRAINEIDQALQFSPGDADTLFLAALTYETLGMRSQTLKILERAPRSVLDDLGHWPDVADLARDSRYIKLAASQSQ